MPSGFLLPNQTEPEPESTVRFQQSGQELREQVEYGQSFVSKHRAS